MLIRIKNKQEQEFMKYAGAIAARILFELEGMVEPGIDVEHLDSYAHDEAKKANCDLAFLNYHGFPKSVCVSINEEIVHGIPTSRILNDGDIVTLDFGTVYNGYFADSALTIPVGNVSDEVIDIIKQTQEALYAGIGAAKPGNRLGCVSDAIYSARGKYGMVTEFGGHGIGDILHDDPFVYNIGEQDSGIHLRPGMALALEPMLVMGSPEHVKLDDNWTVATKDGKLSTHFEHSIIITDDEPIVITRRENEDIC